MVYPWYIPIYLVRVPDARATGGRAKSSGHFNVLSAGLPLSPNVCWWPPPLLNFICCTLVAVNFSYHWHAANDFE
jgi:hypothetical protein